MTNVSSCAIGYFDVEGRLIAPANFPTVSAAQSYHAGRGHKILSASGDEVLIDWYVGSGDSTFVWIRRC